MRLLGWKWCVFHVSCRTAGQPSWGQALVSPARFQHISPSQSKRSKQFYFALLISFTCRKSLQCSAGLGFKLLSIFFSFTNFCLPPSLGEALFESTILILILVLVLVFMRCVFGVCFCYLCICLCLCRYKCTACIFRFPRRPEAIRLLGADVIRCECWLITFGCWVIKPGSFERATSSWPPS